MRLRSLHLTNFRQHADTSVEFGSGITGIIGPNGSGKTTLFEAVAWALYGNDAARGRRDSIRFIRADPKAPVRVEMEFELGAHRYRIVRGLSSAELYLDGSERPVATSITAVNEMLGRRLGMSRAEFFNTYFTGQKELSVMTALGPTERGQFLSRVLGYERLRAAQELARDRRRELNGEITGLRQAMPDAESVDRAVREAEARRDDAQRRAAGAREARDAAKLALEKLAPQWEGAQRGRAHRQQAEADLRVAEGELQARTREAERAQAAVAEADAASRELAELANALTPLPSLVTERESLDALARDEGRRQALTDAVRVANDDLTRLTERRTVIAEAPAREEEATVALESARAELGETATALDSARTAWARDRQEAETKRDTLRAQYTEYKEQRERIIAAGEDGTCPTCQRPLGTHYRSMLDMLDAQLRAVKQDGQYYKSRVEQLASPPAAVAELTEQHAERSARAAALERGVAEAQAMAREMVEVTRGIARQEQRLTAHRAELAVLPSGYDAARHAVVRRELERLAPLEQRAARLAVVADRAMAASAELASASAAARAASDKVATARATLGDGAADDAAYNTLRAAFEAASATWRDSAVAVAASNAEAAGATEAHTRALAARAELARAEVRVVELTRERRLHEELDQAYSELRTDLNFALRPEISRLASEFIAELTDDRYTELDLDDQYNLMIVEDGTPKNVISGGEEDLANLVLRLAISQMIAERAGHAFSLLILDEVFGSLDDARRQNVVDLLRRLHDRFDQVVLITHIESIRDGCDHVFGVRYDTGSGAAVVQRYEVVPEAGAELAAVAHAS